MDILNKSDKRICTLCKKPITDTYPSELCSVCTEDLLFADVREYIRSNVVNEYMVVEQFNIPLAKVKEWIKEGRIEYCNDKNKRIMVVNCQQCGKAIRFGTICTDCLRSINSMSGVYMQKLNEDNKMRFLNNRNED